MTACTSPSAPIPTKRPALRARTARASSPPWRCCAASATRRCLTSPARTVVVIGGGNVAMDVTRSAIRLGAAKVTCVYRRRQEDMTALPEEVEGAIAEGAEVLTLQAPLKIEADENGHVTALWTQPQIIGEMDKAGRPRPNTASVEPLRIPADTVIVAIGQGIESRGLEESGIKIQRGGNVDANTSTQIPDMEGVFAGGDCVTGPATVIRAIAAGKAAAANIDEYLGFNHEIKVDVTVPAASEQGNPSPWPREFQ